MEGNKLYVGNLKFSCTIEQLKELFANYGSVQDVTIIEGRGFGFVEFSNADEANAAKEALNGTEFLERMLKVNEAFPPKKAQRRDDQQQPD
jgi:RNA recognition motif-containing protein